MADWGKHNQRVEILIHLNRTPPTIGDSVATIVLCRVLRSAGYPIALRVNEGFGKRNDWQIEGVQSKPSLLKTWREFFVWLDPHPSSGNKDGWEFSIDTTHEAWQVKVGNQVLPTSGDFYVLAPRILASLWAKKELDHASRKAFF
jgi:hypothetical protein